MKKWLFNPFTYIAGTRALVIGWAVIMVTAIIAFFAHAHFDGVIDMHFGASSPMLSYFIEPLIDWLILVLCLYGIARIASESSVRFIDIAGTIALARWPLFLVSFLGFIPVPEVNPKASLQDLMAVATNPNVIIQAIGGLPFIVLFIVLLYNAYRVSANLKGGKAAWSFIAGLVVAEILSKIILMNLPIYK